MDKSFFYLVEAAQVDEYKNILNLMNIPYEIEAPIAVLTNGANKYTFVFPNMSVRLYGMVRKLFKGDGLPYPN